MLESECGAAVGQPLVEQGDLGRISGKRRTRLLVSADIAQQHATGIGRSTAGADAVLTQHRIDIPRGSTEYHQPHPEIEVFRLGHARIEAPDPLEVGAAEGGSDIDVERAVEHLGQGTPRGLRALDAGAQACDCTKNHRIAGDEPHVRFGLENGDDRCEIARAKQIVAIEQRNQRSS